MIGSLNLNPNPAPAQPHYTCGNSGTLRKEITSAGSPVQKLTKAAQEFEGILLSSLLEEVEKSSPAPSDAGQDAGSETLRSLGTQAVAQALAHRGGLGIAGMIIHHFSPSISSERG